MNYRYLYFLRLSTTFPVNPNSSYIICAGSLGHSTDYHDWKRPSYIFPLTIKLNAAGLKVVHGGCARLPRRGMQDHDLKRVPGYAIYPYSLILPCLNEL